MNVITVKFYNRNESFNYTRQISPQLLNDPDVEYIIDTNTGEILYHGDDGFGRYFADCILIKSA